MKQFIVLSASVVLGLFIVNLIAGSGDDSIVSHLSDIWDRELAVRTYAP